MKKKMLSFAAAAAAVAATLAADARANGLKRMYVLDCGHLVAMDTGRQRRPAARIVE